ncbi:hypothetical protein PUV54_07765 [Hyphococcus flavus]|uniref:Uncharacterized protein n=1 Tax=Hyphococcus flavus TaxID=1866326 RepID=A0AAE9ZEC7_9PROT|nr:hypothetical protein [Hyphococcus flavus]WDI33091.1 hypothetical protein PUV54_07765 [Hyphococcus flavus]
MEGMIGEVRATAEAVFLGGDWIWMGMVIVAAIIGLFSMRNAAQVLCASLLSMIALGLIWVLYGGATSETPTAPGVYMDQLNGGLASLSAMTGSTLVSYLLVFAVVILVLFILRSLVIRN